MPKISEGAIFIGALFVFMAWLFVGLPWLNSPSETPTPVNRERAEET
jgi:hypothetical protein